MSDPTISRRQFLGTIATGLAAAAVPSALLAQGVQQGGGQQISAATNMAMDDARYRPVSLPSKGSGPSMTAKQRDETERHIHCQCGCNLDVYTCRTTDFTCSVSPAMHRDVMSLVDGGYSAQEIINAFVHVYGEKVLMAPPKRGFDLTGYLTPFAALGGGAALVVALLRKWRPATSDGAPVASLPVDASPEELERIDAAVRSDET